MNLHEICRSFVATRRDDTSVREQIIKEARRLLGSATSDDWNCLSHALEDDERKWFVAAIFSRLPVPKRLLKPLVAIAIDIARKHEDEYIRHRVEVQLGNEHRVYPLPHRTQGSGESDHEGG